MKFANDTKKARLIQRFILLFKSKQALLLSAKLSSIIIEYKAYMRRHARLLLIILFTISMNFSLLSLITIRYSNNYMRKGFKY